MNAREEQLARDAAARLPDECLIEIIRSPTPPIVEVRVSGHPLGNGSRTFADADEEAIARFLERIRPLRP